MPLPAPRTLYFGPCGCCLSKIQIPGKRSWPGAQGFTEWERGSFQRVESLARNMVEGGRVEGIWWAKQKITVSHTCTHARTHARTHEV